MYKAILFDLDHTLWDFNKSEDVSINKLLEKRDIDIEEFKKVYIPINRALWHRLDQKNITKKELINSRFSLAFLVFGKEVDGKELAMEYEGYISKEGIDFEGAKEFLEELDSYDLYAATNGVTNIQKGRLQTSKISKFFKDVFISDEIGYSKPDSKFFEYILEKTGLKKEEVIMIGDNLLADVKGAIDFGIDAIWYNPKGIENSLGVEPIIVAKNYEEILKFLRKKA